MRMAQENLLSLASQVIAKHRVPVTPEELLQIAHKHVISELTRLVREHHDTYDAAVPLLHDTAEGVLRSWLENDE